MSALRLPSPLLVRLFRAYVQRYARRHFAAVRVAGPIPAAPAEGPVVVVMNHPSWWDPLIGLLLAERVGRRFNLAPWEAAALERWGLFRSLGALPVDASVRGTRAFVESGRAALARDDCALWVTAQGRFADARERPPGLRAGVAALLAPLERGVVLPLALEYGFWDERLPEAFARFGEPLDLAARAPSSREAWVARLEAALAATQDALAVDVRARDPLRFEELLAGDRAVSGVYGLWRRARALLGGGPPQARARPALAAIGGPGSRERPTPAGELTSIDGGRR